MQYILRQLNKLREHVKELIEQYDVNYLQEVYNNTEAKSITLRKQAADDIVRQNKLIQQAS